MTIKSFKQNNYFIDTNYIARSEYVVCEQMHHTDQFQDEVYFAAKSISEKLNYNSILDIGCGSAFKLIKYFGDKKITGLELEPNLTFIKSQYPDKDFRLSDFNAEFNESFDLIICSDVVEHLLDPDELLNFISKIDFKHLVISTPERSIIQKLQKSFGWVVEENGPPHNKMHVREWSAQEFRNYISEYFNIDFHFLTQNQAECQVIVASKRF